MTKKKEQSEQTKEKIAEASKALFIKKGYNATSIGDIVKATGCSAGNIYYHFKSKEGLLLYIIEEWDREWEEKWLTKESNYLTTVDKLYGMAEHLVVEQLNHPLAKVIDEFFNNSEKVSDVQNRIDELVKGYINFNKELLQRGIDNGELKTMDVTRIAIILDSLLYGLSQHSSRMDREATLAVYRLAIDVFLHGVAK